MTYSRQFADALLPSHESQRLERVHSRGHARLNSELLIDPFKMGLHRPRTQREDRTNLGISLALDQPVEDFRFSLAELEHNE